MSAQYILDISRLFSRRHFQHDTGIDRVERGYLEFFQDTPYCIFLIKYSGFRFIISAEQTDQLFLIAHFEKANFFSKLAVFKALKNLSRQSLLPQKLSAYKGATYINVGHTGHKTSFWKQVKSASIRAIVMIHDVIPLDFPEYSRADKIDVFKRKFQNWCQNADLILTPSTYSKERVMAWSSSNLNVKVAPLYVPKMPLPPAKKTANAWIILGTIEPRKNHMFLFQTWQLIVQELGDAAPQLWIIGARGWLDQETQDFLEQSELMGQHIIEWGALDDDLLKTKLAEAKGLLFPSKCEGFGLPLHEAAILGKPVFASRIPPFIDAFGNDADCLMDINDCITWKLAITGQPKYGIVHEIKNWKAHITAAILD